jgi:hypothetical protein
VDPVLELASTAMSPHISDQFHLVFLLVVLDAWWRACIWHAIGCCLVIRGQEIDVEDIMNPYGWVEFKAIHDW